MNNLRLRRKAAIVCVSAFILSTTTLPINDPISFTRSQKPGAYASYSNGDIFIGSEDELHALTNIGENDVLVIDDRDTEDPQLVIENSYKITSEYEQYEIIEALLNYEDENPSSWSRSEESLKTEWCVHNFCFQFGIVTNHTDDVNFNNADEALYDNPVVKTFF